jgi:hypothetical protein
MAPSLPGAIAVEVAAATDEAPFTHPTHRFNYPSHSLAAACGLAAYVRLFIRHVSCLPCDFVCVFVCASSRVAAQTFGPCTLAGLGDLPVW